jgi:hypothetical protein
LLDARRIAPTYLKTDTHWNAFGGFVACQEIAKKLPGLEPLSLDSFELKKTAADGGDLAGLLGLKMAEENAVSLIPKTNLPSLEVSANPARNPDYKGPSFAKNSQEKGVAVVFCDSFGPALMPFLDCCFGKAACLQKHELDARWIEREKPDVVISEMVEREFNVMDPNLLRANEALQ